MTDSDERSPVLDTQITTDSVAGWSVLRVCGLVDLASIPGMQRALHAASAEQEGPLGLAIDLSEVSSIDSVGVGLLLGALRDCRRKGRRLLLVAPSAPVLEFFDLTGLHAVFDTIGGLADGDTLDLMDDTTGDDPASGP